MAFQIAVQVKKTVFTCYFNLLRPYINKSEFETIVNGKPRWFAIRSGAPQVGILDPLFYVRCKSDISTITDTII